MNISDTPAVIQYRIAPPVISLFQTLETAELIRNDLDGVAVCTFAYDDKQATGTLQEILAHAQTAIIQTPIYLLSIIQTSLAP